MGQNPEQEPIRALFERLVEDGRALVKAELALFRTDFYRRMARARTGALLLFVGAIMAQAAAVTFLVTLSFVLTPWIGRLGGATVSVVLGVGIAITTIRIGFRKLIMIVEDYEDEDDAGKPVRSALDILFDRMRQRSREARDQLAETVDMTQARLHPQVLIADLVDHAVDHAQTLSHAVVDALRRRPFRVFGAAVVILLLIVRPPVRRIVSGLGRVTRGHAASFTKERRQRTTHSEDEETSS